MGATGPLHIEAMGATVAPVTGKQGDNGGWSKRLGISEKCVEGTV